MLFSVLAIAPPAAAVQTVVLDFDTFTDTVDEPTDHIYSFDERIEIKAILEEVYRAPEDDPMGGPFGVKFEILDPLDPPPPFTTSILAFNKGTGGSADGIDFRNLDDDDGAEVAIGPLLSLFVGTPKAPEFGGGFWSAADLSSPEAIIFGSANAAAHEVGHLLGLRHHDGFGPIGSGIAVSAGSFDPVYPGPVGSTLTSQHIMGLNISVALSANNLLSPSHFAERSSLKLQLAAIENEPGPNPLVIDESEYPLLDASDDVPSSPTTPIPLSPLPVPNTLESPHPWAPIHGGPDFLPATIGVVTATLADKGPGASDVDHFLLDLEDAGRVTVEVISAENVNTSVVVNPNLALLAFPGGGVVPYETGEALNADQFESTDSLLLDVALPAGDYVVEVFPATPGATGDYELLVYTFPDVDFPLTGDYNDDGFVDAADYTVWRDAVGTDGSTLENREGSLLGTTVDIDDWIVWKENFGEFKLDALDAAAVPEPGALWLLPALAGSLARRRR